jgi:hypothetical protein
MKEDTTPIDPTWMEKTGGFARDKTLRDEFAGLAMQGLLAGLLSDRKDIKWDSMGKSAYWQADAMLKARDAK